MRANDEFRVLVVEDNRVNQMMLQGLLESHGLSCQLAANGSEALWACGEQVFDVILMDIQLPDMDGYTTAMRIRELEGFKHIPIVAITADTERGAHSRALARGMDYYLHKPLDPEALFTVFSHIRETRRASDDLREFQASYERMKSDLGFFTKILRPASWQISRPPSNSRTGCVCLRLLILLKG